MMCAKPGQRELTQALADQLTSAGFRPSVQVGKCEQCGRNNMIPCNGDDFGGCYVNDGYILDEKLVRSHHLHSAFAEICICVTCCRMHVDITAACFRNLYWYGVAARMHG